MKAPRLRCVPGPALVPRQFILSYCRGFSVLQNPLRIHLILFVVRRCREIDHDRLEIYTEMNAATLRLEELNGNRQDREIELKDISKDQAGSHRVVTDR